jgi:hypothetical protein
MGLRVSRTCRLGVLAAVATAAWGCGSAHHRAHTPRPPPTRGTATLETSAARVSPGAQLREAFDDSRFEPAPPAVRRACHRTAREVGYPILCPRLIPSGATLTTVGVPGCATSPTPHGLIGTYDCSGPRRRWEFGDINWGEFDWGIGHVIIQGAPRTLAFVSFLGLDPQARRAYPPRRRGQTTLSGGIRAAWIAVPQNAESANAGHTCLVWHQHGRTYEISAHAPGALGRAFVLNMLHHSRFVRR